MPVKQQWTIRIVQLGKPESDRVVGSPNLPGLWIEQFRRLAVIRVLKKWDGTDSGTEVLEIRFPGDNRGINTKVWAEQNAERMRTFGINAAAAPEWKSGQMVSDSIGGI